MNKIPLYKPYFTEEAESREKQVTDSRWFGYGKQ